VGSTRGCQLLWLGCCRQVCAWVVMVIAAQLQAQVVAQVKVVGV
jgi:hypothetical protein